MILKVTNLLLGLTALVAAGYMLVTVPAGENAVEVVSIALLAMLSLDGLGEAIHAIVEDN